MTPAPDGVLRAIVAADLLAASATADDGALVRERLIVFHGYFALLSVMATVAGYFRSVPPDASPEVVASLVRLQSAHASVLVAVFVLLRFGPRRPGLARALDLVATIATSITAAVGLSMADHALAGDVSATSFFILFFVLRAALVPSRPWLATMTALVSAVPFALGIHALYRNTGAPDPVAATSAALRVMLAAVVAVLVVSKTVYGLRREVQRAVRLGQYDLHEKIGEGGMGVVYRASHAMLKRPTAIKLIPPERTGPAAIARFQREVQAASGLSHPNNIAIYDFGQTQGGVFYYAMELLDGEDLGRLVAREGPLSVERTLHVLRQLAAALGEAHDAGLVHRDVKPQNVMLCTRGGVPDFVKLLDFGLVKSVFTSGATTLTSDGAIAGTPLYMAPEVILAPQNVGLPADIYALGCVAYFLLTGSPPFVAESVVEVCAGHVHEVPLPVSRRANVDVPAELDALVTRCLAKRPEARPTAREVGETLALMTVA